MLFLENQGLNSYSPGQNQLDAWNVVDSMETTITTPKLAQASPEIHYQQMCRVSQSFNDISTILRVNHLLLKDSYHRKGPQDGRLPLRLYTEGRFYFSQRFTHDKRGEDKDRVDTDRSWARHFSCLFLSQRTFSFQWRNVHLLPVVDFH